MVRRARFGIGTSVLAALGCARLGYESLPDGAFDPLPNDTNVTRGGGLGGSGGANDAGSSGGVSAGGGATSASGSGGAGSSPDAGSAANGGTSGATLAGCEPAVPTATWSFTGDTEGWQLEADPGASGNLTWTGAAGDPAPGALELDATVTDSSKNVRAYLDLSSSDLTGKVLYARVFLESGSGVSAKVFVQSAGGAWGDGHEVYLDAEQWHCVSFDPRDTSVSTPDLDRTAIRRIGVFFYGDASAHLYIDQISY